MEKAEVANVGVQNWSFFGSEVRELGSNPSQAGAGAAGGGGASVGAAGADGAGAGAADTSAAGVCAGVTAARLALAADFLRLRCR
jgi:hypothetical protein